MRLVMCRSLLLLAVLGAVAVPSHALLRKGDIELPKLLKCPEDIDCDCNPFTLTANEYIGCINAALPEGDAPVTPPTCSDKLSTEAYANCLETCLVDEGDAIGYLLCLRDFIKQDLDKFGLDKLSAAFAVPILPLPKIPECPLPPYSAAQPPVEPCTEFCNPEEGDWFEYTECLALYYADDEVPDFEPPYCSPKLPYDDYQACTTDCDIEDSASEYVECLAEAVKTYYEDSKLSLFDLHKKKQKCDPCADPINCPCDPWKELCSTCGLPPSPPPAPSCTSEIIDDFETGDIGKWDKTTTMNQELCSDTVLPGTCTGSLFGGFAPFAGGWSGYNPWDGSGGVTKLCTKATFKLTPTNRVKFEWRAQWDTTTTFNPAPGTQERTFSVEILDSTNIIVQTTLIATMPMDTTNLDSPWTTAVVQPPTVEDATVCLVWNVPEFFTGPSDFGFDNVRLDCEV